MESSVALMTVKKHLLEAGSTGDARIFTWFSNGVRSSGAA